ncbi:MAG: AMP-binding protein [Deltaproteobacteria bacterium]|jgi:acyl-[acyl-carrier-protein]-phospholipid O-acyltransferase/long-chain-fatty-acid--[acyl-carrier-protein] ligase|nr:AMP-binding protein [Deltaproteobacteria bacterium]
MSETESSETESSKQLASDPLKDGGEFQSAHSLPLKLFIKLYMRPSYTGLEHLRDMAAPGIIVSNRTSLLDAALISLVSPHKLTIVMDEEWAKSYWVRVLGKYAKILPVRLDKALAQQGVKQALENGERLLLFPEFVPTRAQSITEVSDEAGRFVVDSGLPIILVNLDGPQYTRFGAARKLVHNLPKKYPVKVSFFPPKKLDFPNRKFDNLSDYLRRSGDALYFALKESRFLAKDYHKNLWNALEEAASRYGRCRLIAEDYNRSPMSYRSLISKAKLMSTRLETITSRSENVGIMLPNSLDMATTLFALWSQGRVPVMLNYTQGHQLLNYAINTASIKTVISSKGFAKEFNLEEAISQLKVDVVYIEDFHFSFGDKVAAFLRSSAPAPPSSPAAIFFTSGSEGKPKGVVHSHESLLSNDYQMTCHLEYSEDDVFFDPMPMFHTIGLNMLFLAPVLLGMYSFLYISPLHTHRIPKLIYELSATMVVGSDTFANAWAREAHPRDLSTLRIFLAGSDHIKEKTHELYFKKFGLRLYEGYGVTEAAPVIAVSTQMHFKEGPCGRFIPGLEYKLEPVPGLDKGGVLHIKGPNVMVGYLSPDKPGQIESPPDRFHNTGDIVEVDDDGYVWIRGRYKRFAKIGGEMVSLVAVEEVINQLWPGRPQAVMSVEDEHKGERLVLVSQEPTVDVIKLREGIREAGLPEIAVPRQFVCLEKIPLNPVGKLDFVKLQQELDHYLKSHLQD